MTTLATIQTDPLAQILQGRSVYHAAPLHYLPSILAHSKLMSAELGTPHGIRPRKYAHRRDRMLGLHRYVHFSFDLITPLLTDKLAKGMPHCVLELDSQGMYANNPERIALLPFNTKAWRSRADSISVSNPQQMATLLDLRLRLGRYPSLEFLVRNWVALDSLRAIWAFSECDFDLIRRIAPGFDPTVLWKIQMRHVLNYTHSQTAETTRNYIARCSETRLIQPLPDIPFD